MQGILTEGEGTVQLTSLYELVHTDATFFFRYTATYFKEEVKRTEPFPFSKDSLRKENVRLGLKLKLLERLGIVWYHPALITPFTKQM
jgi:hypothetical protein